MICGGANETDPRRPSPDGKPSEGSAFVTVGDHQGAVDAGQRVLDGGDDKCLPFPADGRNVPLARRHEPVDQRAVSQRAHQYDIGRRGWRTGGKRGCAAGDAANVILEIARGAQHAGPVVASRPERGYDAIVDKGDRPGRGL